MILNSVSLVRQRPSIVFDRHSNFQMKQLKGKSLAAACALAVPTARGTVWGYQRCRATALHLPAATASMRAHAVVPAASAINASLGGRARTRVQLSQEYPMFASSEQYTPPLDGSLMRRGFLRRERCLPPMDDGRQSYVCRRLETHERCHDYSHTHYSGCQETSRG